ARQAGRTQRTSSSGSGNDWPCTTTSCVTTRASWNHSRTEQPGVPCADPSTPPPSVALSWSPWAPADRARPIFPELAERLRGECLVFDADWLIDPLGGDVI